MDGHSFESNLAAAAGEDAALRAELLAGFIDGVHQQIDLLSRARCDGNWIVAAQRLKSLGATFHANALTALAEEALDAAPGDPSVIRQLRKLSEEYSAQRL